MLYIYSIIKLGFFLLLLGWLKRIKKLEATFFICWLIVISAATIIPPRPPSPAVPDPTPATSDRETRESSDCDKKALEEPSMDALEETINDVLEGEIEDAEGELIVDFEDDEDYSY